METAFRMQFAATEAFDLNKETKFTTGIRACFIDKRSFVAAVVRPRMIEMK